MTSDVGPAAGADAMPWTALALMAFSGAGKVVGWSEAASDLLGYRAVEAVGLDASRLFSDPSAWPAILARMDNRSGRTRAVLRGRDASRVEVALRTVPVAESDTILALALPAADARAAIPDPGDEDRIRLAVMHEASARIGRSLDVVRTAEDLIEVLVPALGDMGSVTLADSVLAGNEPLRTFHADEPRRLVAAKHAHGPRPGRLVQVGELVPPMPGRPEFSAVFKGQVVVSYTPEQASALLGNDPRLVSKHVPPGMRQSMGAPLFARGVTVGYVVVARTRDPRPFVEADIELMREIATRAGLAVDNARRFTREHRTAVMLQHSLLPRANTDTAAAETAGAYRAAVGTAGVGGDWFDVIPLSSLRVALVVGDVVGHGLQATATMARLRTAVQTLSYLDLPPDEVLLRLDDLVHRVAAEAENSDGVGASCLYCVYDPITRICQMASAGHPLPAVVHPDGTARYLDIDPGPLLGVGGMPFEVSEVRLPPDSTLALYTDGLTSREQNSHELLQRLASACRPERKLSDISDELVRTAPRTPPHADDVTVLLARLRAVPPESTAAWTFPAEATAVAQARKAATGQLSAWGLEDLAFSTELVVSELVTNAIRHADSAAELRLTRDRVLVCEVSDASNTQPRLRHARATDEGGRGLFLIAQLCSRWGNRYGTSGKTIWTEQPIGGA